MSFDIRRATKAQLDKINAEIKAGKSGKNYTIHQSGGLDFILTENMGVELEAKTEQFEISRGIASKHESPICAEREEIPLEFNFGP